MKKTRRSLDDRLRKAADCLSRGVLDRTQCRYLWKAQSRINPNPLFEDGPGPGLGPVGGEFQPSFETGCPGGGAHLIFVLKACATDFITYLPVPDEVRLVAESVGEIIIRDLELDYLRDQFWQAGSRELVHIENAAMQTVFKKLQSVAGQHPKARKPPRARLHSGNIVGVDTRMLSG